MALKVHLYILLSGKERKINKVVEIGLRVLVLVIGYIFGNFQTAFIYGKMKGIDIREHGSGNAGTTNTLRVLGTKAGLIVFVGDMLKAIISITIVRLIFKENYSHILQLLIIYTGFGCILGHDYPCFIQFKGGKGIASTGGIMVASHWAYFPVGLVLFFGNFLTTHYVSLGSLVMYLGFFIQTIIMGQMGVFGMSQNALIEMYLIVFIMTVMAFVKHRSNIQRLINKEERKTYLLSKNKSKGDK